MNNTSESNAAVAASAVAADIGILARPTATRATPLNAAAQVAASHLSQQAISPVIITGLARLIDFAALLAAGVAIYLVYVLPREGMQWSYAAPLLFGAFAAVLAIEIGGGYSFAELRRGIPALARVFAA